MTTLECRDLLPKFVGERIFDSGVAKWRKTPLSTRSSILSSTAFKLRFDWKIIPALEKACKKRVEIDDRKNMVLKPSWFWDRRSWQKKSLVVRWIVGNDGNCSQEKLANGSALSGVRALTKTCVVTRVNPVTTTILVRAQKRTLPGGEHTSTQDYTICGNGNSRSTCLA